MEKPLPFDLEYREEVYRIFNEGGILYFIERTDTNEYYYEPLRNTASNSPYIPDSNIAWSKTIDWFTLSGAFLSKEDAEEYQPKPTEGGCRYCHHGAIEIPTIITEHEFVPV